MQGGLKKLHNCSNLMELFSVDQGIIMLRFTLTAALIWRKLNKFGLIPPKHGDKTQKQRIIISLKTYTCKYLAFHQFNDEKLSSNREQVTFVLLCNAI